jgi:hypothetical protein
LDTITLVLVRSLRCVVTWTLRAPVAVGSGSMKVLAPVASAGGAATRVGVPATSTDADSDGERPVIVHDTVDPGVVMTWSQATETPEAGPRGGAGAAAEGIAQITSTATTTPGTTRRVTAPRSAETGLPVS